MGVGSLVGGGTVLAFQTSFPFSQMTCVRSWVWRGTELSYQTSLSLIMGVRSRFNGGTVLSFQTSRSDDVCA